MLLKERTSVSNEEKTRTRDSTHYRGEKKMKKQKFFSEEGEEGEEKE